MIKRDYPVATQFHAGTSYITGNLPAPGELESGIKPYKEYPNSPGVQLPGVDIPNAFIYDLLLARESSRDFNNQAIELNQLNNILFAGYGNRKENNSTSEKPVPSAGGLYPLELYVLAMNVKGLHPGIYHYHPHASKLEFIDSNAIDRELLSHLFLQQSWIMNAAVVIIATTIMERTLSKYRDRGYRYILFEAGHVFQNMNLVAAAHKIGAVNIGAFLDDELGTLLRVDADEKVIYAMAMGGVRQKGIPLPTT
jgi:SagB-type dehydrogenase family enzyme